MNSATRNLHNEFAVRLRALNLPEEISVYGNGSICVSVGGREAFWFIPGRDHSAEVLARFDAWVVGTALPSADAEVLRLLVAAERLWSQRHQRAAKHLPGSGSGELQDLISAVQSLSISQATST